MKTEKHVAGHQSLHMGGHGIDSADYATLKAAFRLIETAGYEALSEVRAAEAAKQPTAKLHEHAAFLAALGNGVAQFTVWMHARARQSGAEAPVTH